MTNSANPIAITNGRGSSMVQRVAHRGGSHLAPENTMAAFRTALTLPIDAIECDVQMSRDGRAIVFHDYTVERLTDGEGNIIDLDFATLRSLNAAAHFRDGWPQTQKIPTLQEVLKFAKGRTFVYIEIKFGKRDGAYERYPNIAETVVQEIRAANMLDKVLIISFDWPILMQMKSLEPLLQTGAIVSRSQWKPEIADTQDIEQAAEMLVSQLAQLGVNWINLDSELFSEMMLAAVHRHGLKLGLWTVNTLEEMQRFADAGVDSLTSDRPDLFAQLRER
jgi:glycerophosphoryl diester phosphodiesterase